MMREAAQISWETVAILVGRLIFAAILYDCGDSQVHEYGRHRGYITSAGLPFPLLSAWLAALFEYALILCFLTGAYFSEAALPAATYVLACVFPSMGQPAGLAISRGSASSSIRFLAMNLGFVSRT